MPFTHTYAAVGNYTATITATNGLTVSASSLVKIAVLSVTLANDSPTSLGSVTQLTAVLTATPPATYELDFGDGSSLVTGTSGTNTLPFTHTYAAVGNYTATITATNGLTDAASSLVTITALPVLSVTLTNDSPTLLGRTTHLTAVLTTTIPASYQLNFGDGSTLVVGTSSSNTLPFAHTYAAAGTYTTIITASNGSMSRSVNSLVIVITPPPPVVLSVTLANDSPTFLGSVTHLTAVLTTTPLATYQLDFGDGSLIVTGVSSTNILPFAHTYAAAGSYMAIITATNGLTQSASSLVTITALPPPAVLSVTLANDSPTSLGNVTHLTAVLTTTIPASYELDFGDGSAIVTGASSTNTLPFTHIYAAAGNYTALIAATNGVSMASASTLVTVISNNGLFGTLTSQSQGRLITYTFIVTNASATQSALNVIISGSVPANTHLFDAGTALGFTTGGDYGTGYVQSSAAITLLPGESVQITWTVEVTALASDVTTFGHATSDSSTIKLSVSNHFYRLFMPVIRKNAVLIQ